MEVAMRTVEVMRINLSAILKILLVTLLLVSTTSTVLAFNVSGTVTNQTGKTGRIYLRVQSVFNNSDTPVAGLSIPDGTTSYAIRGVPDNGGDFVVSAFLDTKGDGVQHANDPVGMSPNFNSSFNTGVPVTLSNPDPVATLLPPSAASVTFGTDSAAIFYKRPENNNGNQIATSYRVYWSATENPGPGNYTGRSPVMSSDAKEVFVVYNLAAPSTYFFAVTSSLDSTESTPVNAVYSPASGTLYNVSATVITTGATLPPSGTHLIALLLDGNKNTLFAKAIANPSNNQEVNFSGVPSGTYVLYSVLDLNDNGVIDLGDISDTEIGVPVVVTGDVTSGITVTLIIADAKPYIKTTHHKYSGASSYSLILAAEGMRKRVLNASVSGPQVPIKDLGLGRSNTFKASQEVSLRPTVAPPDAYAFSFEYSTAGGNSPLVASVTGIVDYFAAPLSPIGAIDYSSVTPPLLFSWAQPSPAPGYPYTYNFWVNNPNGWFNSDPFQSMASSTTSVNLTSDQFTAQPGFNYFWIASLQDSYGNLGEASASFTPGGGSISGKVTSDGSTGIASTYAVLIDSISGWTLAGVPAVLTNPANGTYSFNNIPIGNYKLYFSAGPGYRPQFYNNTTNFNTAEELIVTGTSNKTGADAVLTAAADTGTIAGVIIDAVTSQPVYNVQVDLLDTSNILIPGVFAMRSTSTGGFQFSALPAGKYKLRLNSGPIYQSDVIPATEYTVTSGATTQVSISLPRVGTGAGTITYTGKVVDGASASVVSASVELVGSATTATTASDGTFSISVPSQTPLYLRISKSGYVTALTNVLAFNQDTNTSNRPYTLYAPTEVAGWYSVPQNDETGTIAGQVTSSTNFSMTLPAVTITATSDGGAASYPVCYYVSGNVSCAVTTTTQNGKFFVLNVPNGKHVAITASKAGYNDSLNTFPVSSSSVTQGRLGLATNSPSFTYNGKLVDTTPTQVAQVRVTLFTDNNEIVGQLSSNTSGIFAAADMLSGAPYYFQFSNKTGFLETYSGNASISGNADKTGRPFTLYPSGQFATWGFSSSFGVINGAIKENNLTNTPIGGATISASVGVVVYDDGSVPVSASTALSTSATYGGRFYVRDVPADSKVTITVTSAPASYSLANATRDYHVPAVGKLTQGSIFLNQQKGNISATPSSWDFSSVPLGSTSTEQLITISNSGPGTVTVISSSKSGDYNDFNIQSGGTTPCPDLPATFLSGQSCTLFATFTPTTSTGLKAMTLSVSSDATNSPTLNISLSGFGALTTPGIPNITSITPWDGQATVNFTAPGFDGGSTILGYRVTTLPAVSPVSGTGPSLTVPDLTNGTQYTFSVQAYNASGYGLAATGTATPFYAPLRIGTTGYDDLASAVSAAPTGGTISLQLNSTPLTLATPYTFTNGIRLYGGYNTDYTILSSGRTIIPGRVNIKPLAGQVSFRNITIK
jgi:hypothetical protein